MKLFNTAFLLLFSQSLLISSVDMEELFSLDINQLQNIRVVTATKNESKITNAPSTLRVITDTMIKERGYLSLDEALSDLPGMQFRNIQGFNSYTFMRGAPSQNNLILMMVDGVVINELNSGGFYGGMQYNLDNIKRIEVMYGPGSALYGTNAISGVINIITRDSKDKDSQGLFASATIGSFNTATLSMRHGAYDQDKKFGYTLSAMYNTTDKMDLGGAKGDNNWDNSMENFEEDLSIDAKVRYENIQLGMIFQDKKASRATNYKSVGTDYYDNDTLWHIIFTNIWAKHSINLNSDTELNSMLYYRDATVADDTVGYIKNGVSDNNQTGYYRPNNLYGIEERLVYKGLTDLELTGGILYEYENLADGFAKSYSDSYLVAPQKPKKPEMIHNTLNSIYAQGQYNINNNLIFTAGLRYEESSSYNAVTTPRSSLVYSKDKNTLKLIFAEAFRAPKPWDYTDNNGNVNTTLLPEEMRSYELYFAHAFNNKIQADLTLFDNMIKNKLTSDAKGGWINQGKLITYGAEASLIYLTQNIKSFINYTYTDSKDENDLKTDEIARHTANAGVTYKATKELLSHISVNYVSKRANPATPAKDIDSYSVVDAKITYKGFKDLNVDMMAKNIFDERYFHTSNRPVSRYRQDQRSYFVRANYRF